MGMVQIHDIQEDLSMHASAVPLRLVSTPLVQLFIKPLQHFSEKLQFPASLNRL